MQVGLWEARDSERYLIHDFADYSPEASQARKREKARDRKRKQRDQKGGSTHGGRDHGVTARDQKGSVTQGERDHGVTRKEVSRKASVTTV